MPWKLASNQENANLHQGWP